MIHKKRSNLITQKLKEFKKKHPSISTDLLESDLEIEADRIYSMADKSIITAMIKRARYTFWMTIITTTIVVGALGAFSGGTALPFITPLLSAFAAWAISLVVIPTSYNERVKGGMDSIILHFERHLSQNSSIHIHSALSHNALKKEKELVFVDEPLSASSNTIIFHRDPLIKSPYQILNKNVNLTPTP